MNIVPSSSRTGYPSGPSPATIRRQLRNATDQVLVAVFTTLVAVLTAVGHPARPPRP